MKNDAKWHRAEVEGTIRQWFACMALSSSERERTKEEWTSKYFSLPANMSADDLALSERLQQPSLRARAVYRTAANAAQPILNPSCRLENPAVDPTHGLGRGD